MRQHARIALRWLLRLMGVGLLAWVLSTQVQWQDAIGLRDGGTVEGHIEGHTDGVYLIEVADAEPIDGAPAAAERIPEERVAEREYGGQAVPDVTYGARTLIRRLSENLPTAVVVLLGLCLLVILTAWRWKSLMRGVGLVMSFARTVRLTFIGGFFNIAVPGATGGDVVKAWYAARATGAGTRAVLSVFVDRFVGLFGLVLFAAGVLFFLEDDGGAFRVPRTVVLVIMACGVMGAVLVLSRPVRRLLGLSWVMRRLPFQHILDEVRAAARLYRGHVGTLLGALGISLFNHAGNATACWLLAGALGIDGITLGMAMALVPLANLLSAIPLLPGGWGVGELAFAYFFGLVGVPPTEAVGLSVVFRLAVLGVNLPGGVLWIFWRGHPSTAKIAADVEQAASHVGENMETE